MSADEKYNLVADAINAAYGNAYGQPAVTSHEDLIKRVRALAEDRRAWLANAKAYEKENQRLTDKLSAREANEKEIAHMMRATK